MLWRRDILEAGGGIEALGAEIAEDAASTKLDPRARDWTPTSSASRSSSRSARARLKDVWSRQLRWARLRRATFPLHFAPEILTTSLVAIVGRRFRGAGIRAEPLDERPAGGRLLVRARGPARLRRGLAAELAKPARLDRARPPAAAAVGRGLARRQLRLARQRHERRRNGVARGGLRAASAI